MLSARRALPGHAAAAAHPGASVDAGASADAHLLAPPDAMQLALAGLQPSLPSTALQAAQHASKLQAELSLRRESAESSSLNR